MPSLTLSESSLMAHSLPPCPKPLKPQTLCFLPLNSFSKKHNSSKLSYGNHPSFIFSRFSRQCCVNSFEKTFRLVLLKHSKNRDGLGLRDLGCKNYQNTTGTVSDKSLVKKKSLRENHTVTSAPSNGGFLKFLLIFGYLTLQGSRPAVAGTDLSIALQSIPYLGDLGDISTGFASAFLLIFFSELGDKTFFIAALLAARNSAPIVFTGTFGALAVMTIISVVLGRTFHYVDEILPFRLGETDLPVDDIAAVCLLVYFGVSTLIDATSSDGLKAEDEQKEAELAVSELLGNGTGILAAANTIISTFLLVFVAEWGDKSFFSTVALAAASSPLGVIGGALAGHGVATLIAVLGGSLLGTFLSEKAIAYIGGVLFLVFAAVTLVEIVS
ncbi:PREDICTED: GDT1-like protein 1, chloroplastic isoform X2 [Populus euphratica]|uniref:GDT1 family protein n=1 Tax=Populus euphratica TaxID=75702 RepID=A0AAJ6XKS1_POPEU|nr:PREDICTED: GDT1-like protein 1, chloroplastic isoform X2 [Populus euphratica]